LKVLTTGLSYGPAVHTGAKRLGIGQLARGVTRDQALRRGLRGRSGLFWSGLRGDVKPIYDPLPPDLIRHPVTTGGFPRKIGILIRHRAVADVTDQIREIASVSAVCDGVTDQKEGVGGNRTDRPDPKLLPEEKAMTDDRLRPCPGRAATPAPRSRSFLGKLRAKLPEQTRRGSRFHHTGQALLSSNRARQRVAVRRTSAAIYFPGYRRTAASRNGECR
jgi:hypothetical protein